MASLIAKLAGEVCVSVIVQKVFKAFGKKDYADIARLGGWCIYGATMVSIHKYYMEHSAIVKLIDKICEFLS